MRGLPAPYCLNANQLLQVKNRLIPLPVTYEHSGIHEAVTMMGSTPGPTEFPPSSIVSALDKLQNSAHHVLGRVIDAYIALDGGLWATLYINVENKPGLKWLITSKLLGCVSLTHLVADEGQVLPLEVSLVSVPARPGCLVRLVTPCAMETAQYKARVIVGSIDTMEVAVPVPPSLTCENVLSKLDPSNRDIIAARLTQLVTWRDDAVTRAANAEEALAAKSAAASTDQALLQSQIAQLFSALDQNARENCGLNTCDELTKAFTSEDPTVVRSASLRTIMCANQSRLMQQFPTELPSGNAAKRQRSEHTEVSAPAAKQHPAVLETKAAVLQRALYETFEADQNNYP